MICSVSLYEPGKWITQCLIGILQTFSSDFLPQRFYLYGDYFESNVNMALVTIDESLTITYFFTLKLILQLNVCKSVNFAKRRKPLRNARPPFSCAERFPRVRLVSTIQRQLRNLFSSPKSKSYCCFPFTKSILYRW